MAIPLYANHKAPTRLDKPADAHAGLWYERFFDRYAADFTALEKKDESKKNWIDTVCGKVGDRQLLDEAIRRRKALLGALEGVACVFHTRWHFATGLGSPHPVENGFAWHPTLGVPYLGGSAVKGIVRAFVEQWDDSRETARERLRFWFGSEDKQPEELEHGTPAGAFIFFDALPVEPPTLAADIMTPHMGKWYAEGADLKSANDPERTPADWHAPVLVPFLVVERGAFLFGIAPRPGLPADDAARARNDLPQVFRALKAALEWIGAGAKTAVGYGRMKGGEPEYLAPAPPLPADPLLRDIALFLAGRPDKNQSEISALIGALKQGRWQGEDARRVAEELKARMIREKLWRPQSNAKKPEKDKDYQNTLYVMKLLGEG